MRLPFDIGNLKFDFANRWREARITDKTWMFVAALVEKRIHEKRNALERCRGDELKKIQGALEELRYLKTILDTPNIENTLKEVVEFTNK